MVKNTAVKSTPVIANFLQNYFPVIDFRFVRFREGLLRRTRFSELEGVVAELKQLREDELETFDLLFQQVKKIPMVLVVSPESYQVLKKRRPSRLESAQLLISEIKDLGYIQQIPRILEDIQLKQRLQLENKKLQQMVNRRLSKSEPAPTLKITLQDTQVIKKQIGPKAPAKILQEANQHLAQFIRSTDKILEHRENEFLVFLSNTSQKQVEFCGQRIQNCLKKLKIPLENGNWSPLFKVSLHKS